MSLLSTEPLAFNVNFEHAKRVSDPNCGFKVLEVSNSHTLMQVSGYYKYNMAKKYRKGVFFRGQAKSYPTLTSSLFRGISINNTSGLAKRRNELYSFLDEIKKENKAFIDVDAEYREPLLQHYGIKTSWLDVVDNIWVALWFACHKSHSFGRNERFLHFEKRDIFNSTQQYAYILLISSACFQSDNVTPGHYKNGKTETVDLRTTVPSHFIRPHAQHAVLVRRLSKKQLPVHDFSEMCVDIIRVPLRLAVEWLGSATTLLAHSLFPPAFYDYGYCKLLENIRFSSEILGGIDRIQA